MCGVNGKMFDWSHYLIYAEIQKLKKETVLFRQGDKSNGFYFLQDGIIMISVLREDGYERIIDFVFPGSLSGEQMINNTASFTTATLMVDSTLYYFSKKQFTIMVKKYPEIAQQLSNSLINKVRLLANINAILNAPVDVQLAHFLLNLHEKKGIKSIELTRNTIAKYIGKSRVAIWKVLKEWQDEGIVEIKNQIFDLKNLDKLKAKIKF